MPLLTTFLLSLLSSELFPQIPVRVSLQHPKALAHKLKLLHIHQKTISKNPRKSQLDLSQTVPLSVPTMFLPVTIRTCLAWSTWRRKDLFWLLVWGWSITVGKAQKQKLDKWPCSVCTSEAQTNDYERSACFLLSFSPGHQLMVCPHVGWQNIYGFPIGVVPWRLNPTKIKIKTCCHNIN